MSQQPPRWRSCMRLPLRWPSANCYHVHDPQEWTPYTCDGRRVYPSKEEAEYTAVLASAIAVSASWWAVRKGLAKLQVPRMPAFLYVGRRKHWLDMDPRAMREWAMAPLAVTLGLTESLRAERPGLPVRKLATDVMIENNSLPAKTVYVGRGSFHHRLSTTKSKSPWTPGHNCEAGQWPARYIVHIRTSPLWDVLPELAGLTLVCDCPMDQLCEAGIFIGLYFDATTPDGNPAIEGKRSRTVALLQGIQALPKGMALPMMSQEALVLAFRKLFPEHWFKNYKFAMVEDLINSPPFCSYSAWLAERGEAWDGPLVRSHDTSSGLTATFALQLGPRRSFRTSIAESAATFALWRLTSVWPWPGVRGWCIRCCTHVTAHLETAGGRRVAWTEEALGRGDPSCALFSGASSAPSDEATRHRLHPLVDDPHILGRHQLPLRADPRVASGGIRTSVWHLSSATWGDQHGRRARAARGMARTQPTHLEPAEGQQRWCLPAATDYGGLHERLLHPPLRRAEFLKLIGNKAHRLIPRCVITQSSGKQRVIDNGDNRPCHLTPTSSHCAAPCDRRNTSV